MILALRCSGVPRHSEGRRTERRDIIGDVTIIHAPSSNKNAGQTRDPDMHQIATGATCRIDI